MHLKIAFLNKSNVKGNFRLIGSVEEENICHLFGYKNAFYP